MAAHRIISGQSTLLARTVHDIRYDSIHDEFVVPNQFGQGVLTFRGNAVGEEAPIRVINGSQTLMKGSDRLDIDPVHGEIYVPNPDAILVFSREATGDAAPIRMIRGPDTHLGDGGRAAQAASVAVDPVNNLISEVSRFDRFGTEVGSRTGRSKKMLDCARRTCMRSPKIEGGIAILAATLAIAAAFFYSPEVTQSELGTASASALRKPSGFPQLVSVTPLPELSAGDGELCQWAPVSTNTSLFAALQQERQAGSTAQDDGKTTDITRPPVRTIRDTDPIYTSIAVDNRFDEIVLQDANLFGIKVFNRLDNTAPSARFTEPKRVIEGPKTGLEYNCGLYVDPKSGDIYSVMEDTGNKIVIFPHDAKGNVAPKRELKTPHRGYAVAVDEEKQELYLTVQYPPKVMVYRKMAAGDEKPLRVLEEDRTGLADVHGIAIDVKNNLLFVNNYGNASNYKVPGTGKFYPPSITVYPMDVNGDTAPLRVIQGPQTQLIGLERCMWTRNARNCMSPMI